MLSRRQLRIQVLKSLYAFHQSEKSDLAIAERELFRGIEKINDLYVYMLLFLSELADADRNDADDVHLKHFPRQEELQADRRLYDNQFLKTLQADKSFQLSVTKSKLSWQTNQDLVRKIFLEIKKSDLYHEFLVGTKSDEKEFLVELVKRFIEDSDVIKHHVEEESIFWADDFDFAISQVIRTIKSYYDTNSLKLIPLYKDEADDKEFVKKLFSQTILHDDEYEKAISGRTKNWEIERIALMDILILKMALAELTSFPNIPVKVSINEFIDISKEYSTPKSKQFVNGIIDKLAADYKEQGKIVKMGRGLVE